MMITMRPAASMSRHSLSSSPRSTPSSSTSPKTHVFRFSVPHLPPDSPLSEITQSPQSERSDDLVLKIEEIEDDDVSIDSIKNHTSSSTTDPGVIVKRGRGRPPKAKDTVVSKTQRVPNVRSKNGCRTCRKRKKKCDERRPECENCEKNNAICEGYPAKEIWISGKQKAAQARRQSMMKMELEPLLNGIDTQMDYHFWEHFHLNLCKVLSLHTETDNPFREILLPMAHQHHGLMHALLCLSGSHLVAKGPTEKKEEIEERRSYHFDRAISILRNDDNMAQMIKGDSTAFIEDPTSASVLVMCLEAITSGDVGGQHHYHMNAARHLVRTQKSPNAKFQNFLIEFFIYHDVSNSVTSFEHHSVLMMDDFQLPSFMIQPEAGALLGVVDGLFGFISKIRQLRDQIRIRRAEGHTTLVHYPIVADAGAVHNSLVQWVCAQPPDTPRWYASELYRQATWLYLHRTINASEPDEKLRRTVDKCLELLMRLPEDASTQSILLMPLFLVGCSAFEEYQRPGILERFDTLQEYSSLGNIKHAKKIVELVWEMMDSGNEKESWDWETIIEKQGWDFLIT